MSAETMARVSGIFMVNSVPAPGSLDRSMVPPMRSMLVLTTSMPTPRPDTAVTAAAVEKPGRKMKDWICWSVMPASSVSLANPLATILLRICATARPRPSSPTSMTIWPPSW